jgi:hypothetical protein
MSSEGIAYELEGDEESKDVILGVYYDYIDVFYERSGV